MMTLKCHTQFINLLNSNLFIVFPVFTSLLFYTPYHSILFHSVPPLTSFIIFTL